MIRFEPRPVSAVLTVFVPVAAAVVALALAAIPLAFAGALLEQGPRLGESILALRPLEPECGLLTAELDGTAAAERDGLLDLLAERGVFLGGCAVPVSSADAGVDPLRPQAPQRHLLSQFLRASAAASF